MTAKSAAYWTTTSLTALAFLSGGLALLVHVEANVAGLTDLGYPAYLATLLGIWKLAGGFALLAPGLARLKEWAYAGIAFDLTGAAFSQLGSGHPVGKALAPLALLAVAAASWALRPEGRRLAGRNPVTRILGSPTTEEP